MYCPSTENKGFEIKNYQKRRDGIFGVKIGSFFQMQKVTKNLKKYMCKKWLKHLLYLYLEVIILLSL